MPELPVGAQVPNPEARSFPKARTLCAGNGSEFTLAPLDLEQHIPALFGATHGVNAHADIWGYLPYGPFDSCESMSAAYLKLRSDGKTVFYALLYGSSATAIGVLSFLNVDAEHGCLEIGHIWYTPQWQRTGANTMACFLLMQEAFEALGYRRLEWKCDSLNARSRAAALRLGFRYEGLFRQHKIVGGRNRDTAWFSIIDSEWPQLRDRLQGWLSWDHAKGPRPSLGSL